MSLFKQKPTQSFVPIKEIRDNVAYMEDGSLRAIMMVSTINFALKSEDERTAILMQFQNFLNTLDFSIQIFMDSRELDINPYIQLLEVQYEKQENDLLKIQINEYIDFIKDYTENVSIMTKNFFVVVPFQSPIVSKEKTSLFFSSENPENKKLNERLFTEDRTQLEQRITIVERGLRGSGLRVITLENNEIKELFYDLFNPGEEKARMLH